MTLSVKVPLGERSYSVLVGRGILGDLGKFAADLGLGRRCAIITDSTVGPLYADSARLSLEASGFSVEVLTVPAGEASKSMPLADDLCRQMIRAGMDRHAFVVALGGGVVGDLAGFVAGIFFRGVPYIQVPTTVLAQVDSSVGGKTGVNAPEGKNLIGVFHQPRFVLADVATLSTLPKREFNEGFAEIIKHAAIRDAGMASLIDEVIAKSDTDLSPLIARNIGVKAAVVGEDEHETRGIRALLNFGHTIGHAIEAAAGYGQLLHGEAISLGLIAATRLSVQLAGLPNADAQILDRFLAAFRLPQRLPKDITTQAVLGYLARDKKFREGKIHFVLLRRFGEAYLSSEVTLPMIEAAIEALRA